MKFLQIIISLFIIPSASFSGQWYKGKPSEERSIAEKVSYRGVAGELGVMMLFTLDSKKALEAWNKPTEGWWVDDTEEVQRGKPIVTLIVFSNCTTNDSGNCDTEIDFRITGPDGASYGEFKNNELWKNKPPPDSYKLGLAVDRFGFIAEPGDPAGKYTVFCKIKDLVSNSSTEIYRSFVVVEANKAN